MQELWQATENGKKIKRGRKSRGELRDEKVTGKVIVDDKAFMERGYICHAPCAGILSDAGKGIVRGADAGASKAATGGRRVTVQGWKVLESLTGRSEQSTADDGNAL